MGQIALPNSAVCLYLKRLRNELHNQKPRYIPRRFSTQKNFMQMFSAIVMKRKPIARNALWNSRARTHPVNWANFQLPNGHIHSRFLTKTTHEQSLLLLILAMRGQARIPMAWRVPANMHTSMRSGMEVGCAYTLTYPRPAAEFLI
jgi:hypothetical protein